MRFNAENRIHWLHERERDVPHRGNLVGIRASYRHLNFSWASRSSTHTDELKGCGEADTSNARCLDCGHVTLVTSRLRVMGTGVGLKSY